MRQKILLSCFIFLLLVGIFRPATPARAIPLQTNPAQSGGVTAYELILAMNTLRVSLGNPALIEDPIVNAVAQSTAEIMAANEMSWHIGDVRGRIQAAGYGGGAQVFATENFAVGTSMGIDQIMVIWSDAEHMRPATTTAYCHIGAGVATSPSGQIYYVLQAAYISGKACGDPTSGGGTGGTGGTGGGVPIVPQIIAPVKIATPDADGKIFHIVQTGQSFWAIAIAYQITIADIEFWNNLSRESKLQVGQKLFIPSKNTAGYATPTPVGMVIPVPADEEGKIVHTVQSYQTLSTISAAYKVTVDTLLALNGLQIDWPLQVGQKLLVSPGNMLSPLEKLTPASDGNYYHTVQSGETLSGIATQYNITLSNLLAWNGLTSDAIIRPDQKLLLMVTPPAPPTATPGPPTATVLAPATPTLTQVPVTRTETPTPSAIPVSNTTESPPESAPSNMILPISLTLIFAGLIVLVVVTRKKSDPG